jgi:hypothetical protein
MADTMSWAAQRSNGLAATVGLLPFMLQQSLQNQQAQMLTSAMANPTVDGSGAAGSKGSKDSGVGGATKSTTTKPAASSPAPEKSGGSGAGSDGGLVQMLLSKMFGEDEDDDLKELRKSLTRERLQMELRKEKAAHREEMARMQSEKRARLAARAEADRVRGQAHRERSKRSGSGVPIPQDAKDRMTAGVVRADEDERAEKARERGRAAFEAGL